MRSSWCAMLPQTVRSHEIRHQSIAYHTGATRGPPHRAAAGDMSNPPNTSASSIDAGKNAGIASAIAQAEAAGLAGDRARAVSTLTALAARAPASSAVWTRLGGYALESGRPDAALAYLQNAVAHEPGDAAAWTNLGVALARLA